MSSDHTPPGSVTIGYDASAAAELALEWAASTAAHLGRPLHILGVRDAESAVDVTTDAAERLAASHPDLPITTAAPVSNPRYALVESGANAAMIVLGNRGRSRWRAALLGTVSLSVAMHAACPVVVLRKGHDVVAPPQRVLVGVDGSHTSIAAAKYAIETAAPGATVRLVMAWAAAATAEHIPAAGAEILSHIELPDRADITVIRDALPGHPVEVLSELAADNDLVVLGRRGAEGFTGLQMGSTAQHVLNEISCPIVIVPHQD